MTKFTDEQSAAINSAGNTIVSASAGSGKTSVMIEKLVNSVVNGVDLDDVLAVTFTKKAAAQIKEKLRDALIARVGESDGEVRDRLKIQLSRIPTANISTIHSLCGRLVRTYFYALDCDGGFDIIASDDAQAKELKSRALENLFERYYDENNADFILLLKCLTKKRSDENIKKLLSTAHEAVRSAAHYERLLADAEKIYCPEGFDTVCAELGKIYSARFARLKEAVDDFAKDFVIGGKAEVYAAILDEMRDSLEYCVGADPFAPLPPLNTTRKPTDKLDDKIAGERFKVFREYINAKYKKVRAGLSDRDTEYERFINSGRLAVAFSHILLQFDAEYAAIKREENKLDYNDLEHLTLRLLSDESLRGEISGKFAYVYVDEYQDVNPVQEEIISKLGGRVFLVGDVKQAIYGFRGSKSRFFADKFASFEQSGGSALRLSSNFRSSDGVLDFVNSLFSQAMRSDNCGFDYSEDSFMRAGGLYPRGDGGAVIHIFGDDEQDLADMGVYSVRGDKRGAKLTREGLAVLSVVEKELQSERFDLKTGKYVPVQAGDICVLTRKNKNDSVEGIVRALESAGYPVSGAQDSNICTSPEVRQILDILSLIDNAEQDVPLVTALLSPVGGLTEDELGTIRIAFKREKCAFRVCCEKYRQTFRGEIAVKLERFYERLDELRSLSQILSAGELIDKILSDSGLEAKYGSGGGVKLRNIMRLSAEGPDLTLAAFLRKLKAGGFNVSSPAAAPSDSIKIMTMHSAKGLEFPIVILADICRTFAGAEYSEMPFDESYGFAPKSYDTEKMLVSDTVLRRLAKVRSDREELKNELNLFYVACTRAMCRLHVMAKNVVEYNRVNASAAKRYADVFDMSRFTIEPILPHPITDPFDGFEPVILKPEPELTGMLSANFMKPYAHEQSVDLPVKSSASAILKMYEKEPLYATHELYGGEGETGTERGTAYHRFLELCDFSVRTAEGIKKELLDFAERGRISPEQIDLLVPEELAEILRMPVFADLDGAQLFREQEFLCRLPANEIMETEASDGILVQGAIDLLAHGDFGWRIIDYKYSRKGDEALKSDYARQLDLYKKAAALITGDSPSVISAVIVNIFRRRQIDM